MFPTQRSDCGQLTVECNGYAEPNNGREVWLADVCYRGNNINKSVFTGNNFLNFKLEQWCFESPCKEYIYIPAEGRASLIHLPTFSIHQLRYVATSTVTFIGNSFSEGLLTENYTGNEVITPLLLKDFTPLQNDFTR